MISPYAILGGALGGLLLLIGTYFYGRNDGAQIQIAKYAAVNEAVAKERAKHEAVVDDGNKWFGIGSLIAIARKNPSGAVSPYSKLECYHAQRHTEGN